MSFCMLFIDSSSPLFKKEFLVLMSLKEQVALSEWLYA